MKMIEKDNTLSEYSGNVSSLELKIANVSRENKNLREDVFIWKRKFEEVDGKNDLLQSKQSNSDSLKA
jgi:hypothetical protein